MSEQVKRAYVVMAGLMTFGATLAWAQATGAPAAGPASEVQRSYAALKGNVLRPPTRCRPGTTASRRPLM